MPHILRGNPNPCVFNSETDYIPICLDTEGNCTSLISISECVIHKTHHYLNEARRITHYSDRLQFLSMEGDTALNRQRLHRRCHIEGKKIQSHRVKVELRLFLI